MNFAYVIELVEINQSEIGSFRAGRLFGTSHLELRLLARRFFVYDFWYVTLDKRHVALERQFRKGERDALHFWYVTSPGFEKQHVNYENRYVSFNNIFARLVLLLQLAPDGGPRKNRFST